MTIAQEELRPNLYAPVLLEAWRRERRGHPLADGYGRYVEAPEVEDPAGGAMLLDLVTYLPNDLLVKMDIMTMAHALEARSPFLDHKVVELAASIPAHLKVRGRQTKYILKRALSSLLPPAILSRGKMGFGVPLARWFRSELKDYAREVLLDPASLQRGYFQPGAVEALLRQHALGEEDHGYLIWSLLVLELWHREVLEGRARVGSQRGEMAYEMGPLDEGEAFSRGVKR
jgi:asparagine synthase (glutamine-hydrolysing)